MTKVVYMTEPGLRKLREELDRLVNIKRPKISQQIGDARDKGDLSENEANVREEKIAINTPIGKGLVGKKIGEQVVINIPSGQLFLEIVEITHI